jgi:hypothetical protein
MQLPVIRGLIKRRILVNFRVNADTMQAFLPSLFRPKLHAGYAIAGICLIRLEQIRPAGLPAILGIASENAAHRISVTWTGSSGEEHDGVFIPRRDTGSLLNHLTGGRIFPGEHHRADFRVADDGSRIDFSMRSRDGHVAVALKGADSHELPPASCFTSLSECSRFFEGGSLGYSVTREGCRLDGLRLHTLRWQVAALHLEHVHSSFFADRSIFPEGSVEFDHALIMRDIPHEWHQAEDMFTKAKP